MRHYSYLLLMFLLFLCACDKEKLPMETLGEVSYYDKFLWVDADTTGIEKTLMLNFNQDAKADPNCYAVYSFVDKVTNKEFPVNQLEIKVDGVVLNPNRFNVKSCQESVKVGFRFLPKSESGCKKGYLRLLESNLDMQGEQVLSESTQPSDALLWRIHFNKKMNPLAKCFMWIGLIILACIILWFLIIKPIKYPKFKSFRRVIIVTQNRQIVYNKTCQFKGARLVVLSSQKEKQSFLNRIFTGRIETYVSPVFVHKIVFVPKKNGKYAFVRAFGYNTIPNPIPESGVSTITNSQENLLITLN